MNDREQQEELIFEQATQIASEAERAAYLEGACRGDQRLRARLEVLLEGHFKGQGFLEGESRQAARPAGTLRVSVQDEEEVGTVIGRYKLLEKVGEGGFGAVYVAEQREPVKRRVALKIIKLGMDTKQVIARFEAERQALALMDHPNIAKVLDAGTTETGRPYFVMELVRGMRITDYCDQNSLSTEKRLDLFMQVCHAIQHAHQKGIIHRDVKPSNILVTVVDGRPVPKVIDFGIAKATQGGLTDKTVYTQLHQFIGTPAYMSPEQAQLSGVDVDTRSDIYSLGVLLYELLTAHTPFDPKTLLAAGLDEMRRMIREKEPPRPSTRISTLEEAERTTVAKHRQAEPAALSRLVRGDLDWIVMKCLEKERGRRYETANALALDIERHLNQEPVTAAAPSVLYRLRKAVQRNKLACGAATALALALVAGLAVSTAMYLQSQAQGRRAQTEALKSRQVAQFLEQLLQSVSPAVARGRDTTLLREIADTMAGRIGKDLKDDPEVELELRLVLARLYEDLGLYREQEQMAREVLRGAREHFGDENTFVADALALLAAALRSQGRFESAEPIILQAIAMTRKLRGENTLQEAAALVTLGKVLREEGGFQSGQLSNKLAQAESAYRASLAIREKVQGHATAGVAIVLWELNIVLENQGRLTEAEVLIREAIDISEQTRPAGEPVLRLAYERLARTLLTGGITNRFPEAESCCLKAIELDEKLYGKGAFPQAFPHCTLAEALAGQGRFAEAESHYRQAIAAARNGQGSELRRALPTALAGLANVLRRESRLAEARQAAEEAVALGQNPTLRVTPSDLRSAKAALQGVLTDLGDTNALEKLDLTRQSEIKPQPQPVSK